MESFRRECWPFVALYLAVFDWKVQRFCWPKGTSLECAESIYVRGPLAGVRSYAAGRKSFRRFSYRARTRPFGYFKQLD